MVTRSLRIPSDITTWGHDPGITSSIQETVLFFGYYTYWRDIILVNTHDQTPLTALEKLKTLAEEAFQPTFATGCMVDPHHKILDIPSVEHAFRNFQGKPAREFLRALRHTRRMLTQLQHFLKLLITDACSNDKLAAWTNYKTDSSASISSK